jgi:hypothetical protein
VKESRNATDGIIWIDARCVTISESTSKKQSKKKKGIGRVLMLLWFVPRLKGRESEYAKKIPPLVHMFE